ncbi:hypothetical protein GV791_14800 [Nocardia cyriacigeorgica]|uniref:Uncharacterized protein n=1 Tax=Nocardia cyriacigeorgica TaxID=135487 RepID=A0A6P1CR16_9NOCA|nr:hypothetical protein [Nocardia cyriacigeorgica]NEW33824.1 hypothetical protein [Nocardia cyriacigeorgica]
MGKPKPRRIPTPPAPKGVTGNRTPPRPRILQTPSGENHLRIRLRHVDVGGPWCLTKITPEQFVDLLGRLKAFESMTYNEIFAPGKDEGKVYAVDKIPNRAALDRLTELQLDDMTEIARLRISGKGRLYGFAPNRGPDFWVLWWDPEHEIWPSTKRNT